MIGVHTESGKIADYAARAKKKAGEDASKVTWVLIRAPDAKNLQNAIDAYKREFPSIPAGHVRGETYDYVQGQKGKDHEFEGKFGADGRHAPTVTDNPTTQPSSDVEMEGTKWA